MGFVKDISDGFRKIISGQDKKKIIENSIIVIIIGIIFLVAGSTILKNKENTFLNGNKQNNFNEEPKVGIEENDDILLVSKSGVAYSIENKMEEILTQIKGVGKVSVMVTYESGSEIVPAYDKHQSKNDTQEEDDNGGKRIITQSESEDKVAYEEQQAGVRKPIILKELKPKVKGVVVVADGAGEPVIKENLVKAVQALVDIAPHKIQVFIRADKDN